VRDIVATFEQSSDLQARLAGGSGGTMQADLEGQLLRMQGFLDELQAIGCELKDYRMGLVDFIGRHQGRDVCLCWRLGESSVAFWHEMDSGFAGRQPVSALNQAE